jgi:hypothetical protein
VAARAGEVVAARAGVVAAARAEAVVVGRRLEGRRRVGRWRGLGAGPASGSGALLTTGVGAVWWD